MHPEGKQLIENYWKSLFEGLEGLYYDLYQVNLSNNQLSGVFPPGICNVGFYSLNVTNNNLCPPYPECFTQNNIDNQDTSGCAETCASGLYDCAGVCDGPGVIYGNGLCCASGTVDCAGTCDGTAVEDCAGVCGGDSVIGGCDNVCGSTAVVDECGVCGGENVCADSESITLWTQGTDSWPDQACNPTNSFGQCDTNDQTHADEWATFVCQLNGYDIGVWTGNKEGGCNGNVSMYCLSGSIPCIPEWENNCVDHDQTKVEITCSMETTRECDFVEGPDAGCDGVCFSGTTEDCSGVCGGETVEDCAGVCGGDSVIGGCDNTCGSTAVADECGVCGGDNSTCTDCAGVVNGTAVEDDCGNCGGDCEIITEGSCDCPEWDTMSDLSWVTDFETCSTLACTNFSQAVWTDAFISCGSSQNNEVIADCNGVCGGLSIADDCGDCWTPYCYYGMGSFEYTDEATCNANSGTWIGSGGNPSDPLWNAAQDCTGVCGGTAVEDCAGTCEGTVVEDCAGTCGGTAVEDCAGICEGDLVEDCAGVCGGLSIADDCGVCGGSGPDENFSCNGIFKPESRLDLQTAVDLWVDDNSLALSTYGEINTWDVSLITDMNSLFRDKSSFNDDISSWDVSNVTDMNQLFLNAQNFNQDLSSWDVSNVTNMPYLFSGTAFNYDLSSWDVSNVLIMDGMFLNATSFNGDISNWNVSNVYQIARMFEGATSFNQDISNWDVSSLTNLYQTFYGATSFNQDISGWDVSSVQYMYQTFYNASSFNQDISGWDISSLQSMNMIFDGASALSSENKCAIHNAFSVFGGWQYSSWSEYCDGTSIDSVCGNVFGDNIINGVEQEANFTYLAGYGYGCTGSATGYTAEEIANLYCELEGYSSYVQFDVINTAFSAEGTLAWTGPPYDDIQEATCSDLNWFGPFNVGDYCPVIYNLVCE